MRQITVRLPGELIDSLEAEAEIEGVSRSAYIRQVLRDRHDDANDRITTSSVRRMLKTVAAEADVRPYLVEGGRGDPDDVTPHALQHGVAWRIMNAEKGNTLYDVRNRLRHRSITTTERRYDHLIER